MPDHLNGCPPPLRAVTDVLPSNGWPFSSGCVLDYVLGLGLTAGLRSGCFHIARRLPVFNREAGLVVNAVRVREPG